MLVEWTPYCVYYIWPIFHPESVPIRYLVSSFLNDLLLDLILNMQFNIRKKKTECHCSSCRKVSDHIHALGDHVNRGRIHHE